MNLEVPNLGHHRTLHDRPTLIILDIPNPPLSIEADLLREALLLEVSDGIIVGVCKEMIDHWVGFADVIFEGVHQVGTVPLTHPSAMSYISGRYRPTLICSELSTAQKTISAKPLLSKGR